MKQFTLDTAEVSADIAAKAKSNKDRAEMIRVIQQINSARADEEAVLPCSALMVIGCNNKARLVIIMVIFESMFVPPF